MTVSNTNLRNDFQGNGVTTLFAFTFKVIEETNQSLAKNFTIKVILTSSAGVEATQTEDVDYTVALSDNGTGNVTFTTAPLLTDAITFLSDIPRIQDTDYINIGTDKFPADSHEAALDRLTLIDQEQDESLARAILLPESSQLTSVTIPVSVANANKAIVVNSAGDDLDAQDLIDLDLFPVTAFAATLLDDTTALEARTTLAAQEDVITTRGDIVRGDSLGDAERLVLGAANTFLKSDGTDASWVDAVASAAEIATGTDAVKIVTPANQGWVKISSAIASNSITIEFTDLSSTYSAYKVFIHTLVPATDNTIFYLRTSTDNGSSFDSGSSDYQHRRAVQNTTTWGQSGVVGDTEIQIVGAVGSGTNEYLDVEITIHTPFSSKFTSVNWVGGLLDATPGHAGLIGQGARLAATDIDAIQFLMSSGNIASGTFTLYGLKA